MNRLLKKTLCMIMAGCLSAGLCACQAPQAPSGNVAESKPNTQATEVSTEAVVSSETEANSETEAGTEANQNSAAGTNSAAGAVSVIHPIVYHKQMVCTQPASWERGANCEYDLFTLTEEDKATYPRLAKALVQFEANRENEAQKSFANMREAMEENYSVLMEGDEYILGVGTLEDTSECEVVRSDSVAFSVFCNYYNYYGGAHPYYAFYGYNFDSQTGHELSCEDVVKDVDALNDILFDKLMDEYGEECSLDEQTVKDHLSACKTGESNYEWLLGYEGVTFYFNPYQLTSFAGGMQIVYLSFADYPELFHDTYQKIPTNYVEPFCAYCDIYTDIDRDGKVEKISATANTTENEYNEMYVYINIDDESYTFNYVDSFNGELYLVHYNEKCYIYNFVSGMGYSEMIQCYDVSDGTAKRVHRYAFGSRVMVAADYADRTETSGMGDEEISESYRAEEVFVDTENFRLSNWLDALSTCDGVVEYSIKEDGLPGRNSDIYNVSRDWWLNADNDPGYFEFTTKTELAMSKLDANGNVSGDITVPKGAKIIYIRTDAKTFADFRLEDGSEVRAEIVCDDYPQKIGNVELEKALDGVLFAG